MVREIHGAKINPKSSLKNYGAQITRVNTVNLLVALTLLQHLSQTLVGLQYRCAPPPYTLVIRSKTYSGYVKLRVLPNAIYIYNVIFV
jgi:hypothetical protein